MSSTTIITSGGLATFSVKTDGSTIPDTMEVFSIGVKKGVNNIPTAKIVIIDGTPATGTFEASSSSTFVPGNTVTIEAGYDTKNEVIFKGIITKQSLRVEGAQGSFLTVECHDEAIKMSVGRKSMTFSKQKDSDIMSSIIGTYSGLSAEITSTTRLWQEQVQYYATDWDFLLSRAETNGMIVTALNNKVSVFKPDADTTPVLKISYGDNLLAFNAELNAITQLGTSEATAWDYKTQKITTGQATNSYAGPGNLSSNTLSEVVGLSDYQLQSTAPLEAADLTTWSEAALVKSAYSKIQGDVSFQGSALVEPGKYITLAGLGTRFNGDHIMSSVHHTIAHGNWTTEASVGLSPIWFTQEPDVMAPPASGLLPGAQGLFNATVKKMYEDPDNQFRVLVDIPLFDANGEGLWARLTNFYSTAGAGAFFMPEVGDEVVVGFLNEDPRYPIILGSMYSASKNKPAEDLEPNEKNSVKAFVSKSGINIAFDDEKKILTLETPGKNTVILSDDNKDITIKDQNSNAIVLSESGITIKSAKNITIEATQNLTLKGTQGVSIESSGGDVEISGMNIKNTADMQYSAEAGATASLKSGAETTIKGAMVMIN
ncbi:type VI secretion system tip protein VgrG [Lacinutrix jangbogonensis]|uniref:type VI secretion system tip protein VgrG n=1 Tax=Lacinutrix jangbogonensis TaxID=1469557 RepID=UPI00053EDABF|nr:type VI secretion system tip protein VgrG [Lacinutrix jangbogonensis]